MCTVSWLHQAGGYLVAFNRDERRTRRPGRPPAATEVRGVPVLSPIDGEAGGTWIGVNALGVTVALANYYPPLAPLAKAHRVSRGLLVAELLDAGSAADVRWRLRRRDLHIHDAFTLALFEPDAPVTLGRWDGHELSWWEQTRSGLVVTSSSAQPDRAEAVRRAAFRAATAHRVPLRPDDLLELHAGHQTAGSELAICVHRAEVETVSLTVITVDPSEVRLAYAPGAPCRTPLGSPLLLPRQSVATRLRAS